MNGTDIDLRGGTFRTAGLLAERRKQSLFAESVELLGLVPDGNDPPSLLEGACDVKLAAFRKLAAGHRLGRDRSYISEVTGATTVTTTAMRISFPRDFGEATILRLGANHVKLLGGSGPLG